MKSSTRIYPFIPQHTFHAPQFRRRIQLLLSLSSVQIVDNPCQADIIVINENSDLTTVIRLSQLFGKPFMFDLINGYICLDETRLIDKMRGFAHFVTRRHSRPSFSYKRLIKKVCKSAAVVTTTSQVQSDVIHLSNSSVYQILDCFDEIPACDELSFSSRSTLHILWEGLPASLQSLSVINDLVEGYQLPFNLHFHIVTDLVKPMFSTNYFPTPTERYLTKLFHPSISFSIYPWSIASLLQAASYCTLGFIPIDTSQIFQAKPANKMLLMWRLGLPTISGFNPSYDSYSRLTPHALVYRNMEELISMLSLSHRRLHSKSVRSELSLLSHSLTSRQHLSQLWAEALISSF